MKILMLLVFLTLNLISYGQVSIDTIPSGDLYLITEAYYIKDDSTYNINREFIDQPSGLMFIPFNDSIIISIDHGGIDKVQYLGYGKEIKNPGFIVSRTDSDFYYWSFIESKVPSRQKAYILKEYVTGSLEQRGRKYFYFNIQFWDGSEYQFYTYLIDPKKI